MCQTFSENFLLIFSAKKKHFLNFIYIAIENLLYVRACFLRLEVKSVNRWFPEIILWKLRRDKEQKTFLNARSLYFCS